MMDLPEAHDVLMAHVKTGPTVSLPLRAALFRTLAESVRCDLDHPPFDRSVMDGYAVRSADVANVPVRLTLVDQVAAGHVPRRPLAAGEAIQINTGAPIPTGADAVVRVEETQPASGGVSILIKRSVTAGHFITPQAAYASAGKIVLEPGARLNPLALAACAACGAAEVTVYRQPTVSILSTGDELIEIDQVPTGAQIRNSNQCLLDALVRSVGCEPLPLGIACDDRDALKDRITQGLKADVLCLTGGVSMGAFDFVPAVLEDCGVTFAIAKMNIKPGRPIHFGTSASGTLVFGLPGNPASAFVGFELLVRPTLAAMEGRPDEFPRPVEVVLCGSVGATRDRRTFVPAYARIDDHGVWTVEPLSWGGSGDALGMAKAGALIVRPPHAPALETGARARAYLLDRM